MSQVLLTKLFTFGASGASLSPSPLHAPDGAERRTRRWATKKTWHRPAASSAIMTARGTASAAKASPVRSEEHTSELQSLMRISYAVFCLKKKKNENITIERSNDNITPTISNNTLSSKLT